MSEQDLVNVILDWLHLQGAWAIRVNSGAVVIPSELGKRVVRMAPAGTPDIIGCWPGGLMLAIECKIGKNKPTAIQRAALDEITDAGGLAMVAWSLDDVIETVLGRLTK